MDWESSFIEFIKKGGIFIYPIILCSIIGLSIFLQKVWMLRTKRTIPEQFIRTLYELITLGKFSDARVLSRTSDSAIARIASVALENADKSKQELKEKIEESGRKEASELGRNIEGLGAISNVSTLLGLLGTISGMIKIFGVISEQPIVSPPSLAGGISEALYTTAFGLSVAIPAFIAYKYTSGKAEEIAAELEEEGMNIMEEIIVANERREETREIAR
ncbi:MotA/TolQ/ExbB proton channel family protein [Desulfobacterota bacterium AH_259_B03_O07]|nr:MotA/TolQ/ExbB proton channel family protein [Desulfobacterota bacterium AH_259_B03_O07]